MGNHGRQMFNRAFSPSNSILEDVAAFPMGIDCLPDNLHIRGFLDDRSSMHERGCQLGSNSCDNVLGSYNFEGLELFQFL